MHKLLQSRLGDMEPAQADGYSPAMLDHSLQRRRK